MTSDYSDHTYEVKRLETKTQFLIRCEGTLIDIRTMHGARHEKWYLTKFINALEKRYPGIRRKGPGLTLIQGGLNDPR